MERTNATFKATINSASRELTPYEKVKFKDTSNSGKLDELTQGNERLVIEPVGYVVLDIHNEKSDNKDYQNFIIIDKSGQTYVTGSKSFWNAFISIWEDMEEFADSGEKWEIIVLRKPSTNFKGKDFLTCSLV